jgi:hypothetical protein
MSEDKAYLSDNKIPPYEAHLTDNKSLPTLGYLSCSNYEKQVYSNHRPPQPNAFYSKEDCTFKKAIEVLQIC